MRQLDGATDPGGRRVARDHLAKATTIHVAELRQVQDHALVALGDEAVDRGFQESGAIRRRQSAGQVENRNPIDSA
jgi:hypothetical protein